MMIRYRAVNIYRRRLEKRVRLKVQIFLVCFDESVTFVMSSTDGSIINVKNV